MCRTQQLDSKQICYSLLLSRWGVYFLISGDLKTVVKIGLTFRFDGISILRKIAYFEFLRNTIPPDNRTVNLL